MFPQEVRLVEKPSKINAGEVLVHAFAEFTDAHSATEALNALQVGLLMPQTVCSFCLAVLEGRISFSASWEGLQVAACSAPQNRTAC